MVCSKMEIVYERLFVSINYSILFWLTNIYVNVCNSIELVKFNLSEYIYITLRGGRRIKHLTKCNEFNCSLKLSK